MEKTCSSKNPIANPCWRAALWDQHGQALSLEGYILVNYHHVYLLINFCESIKITWTFLLQPLKWLVRMAGIPHWKQAGSPGFVFQREFADFLRLFIFMIALCLKSQQYCSHFTDGTSEAQGELTCPKSPRSSDSSSGTSPCLWWWVKMRRPNQWPAAMSQCQHHLLGKVFPGGLCETRSSSWILQLRGVCVPYRQRASNFRNLHVLECHLWILWKCRFWFIQQLGPETLHFWQVPE